MRLGYFTAALLLQAAAGGSLSRDVRQAAGERDFVRGEALIQQYRTRVGITAEMIEALSWLGRGALDSRDHGRAEAYAAETHKLALQQLKARRLDDERRLPIALGAAIEVKAQVMAARSERSGAIEYLRRELAVYKDTSIRSRIQKNIHLLSLEGKPAPPLDVREWLGPKPASLAELRGRPVLLFFWAHWCGDCKYQGPILARLKAELGPQGLVLVGPTQRYGYAARGEDASPEQEAKYIDEVRRRYYADLVDMPAPLSAGNFTGYGASTTPTLVLIDRAGIVRLYHPGEMPYEELAPRVARVVSDIPVGR